jgi:hypothetical protein
MFKRRPSDPAEALFEKLGLDDLLESAVRTTARTGACPLPENEELDPASIKAKASLAKKRRRALRHLSRRFRRQLSAIENARVDPDESTAIAAAAAGDLLAFGAGYSREDERLRREIRVLEAELDGIEQRGEGNRSVRIVSLGKLGLGTGALGVLEMGASAAVLFGAGYPGGWIGTGSLAGIYGTGNTLSAYLLGDHLLRRSSSWAAMLSRIVGTCVLIPAVLLLNGAFGVLRLAGAEGIDGMESGLRLINIERLDVVLMRFDLVGVVLLGPALFAWMTSKWRQARNPNPMIDRIERTLAKLVKARRKLRAAFEASVENRAAEAHADLDTAQDETEASVAAAKHALLGMGEALSEFTADESAWSAAHEGAVNLFRARLAGRVDRNLVPAWVHRAADFNRDMSKVAPAEDLRRKVTVVDRLLERFGPAVAAARARIERTRLAVLGLAAAAARAGEAVAAPEEHVLPIPPLAIEAAE